MRKRGRKSLITIPDFALAVSDCGRSVVQITVAVGDYQETFTFNPSASDVSLMRDIVLEALANHLDAVGGERPMDTNFLR